MCGENVTLTVLSTVSAALLVAGTSLSSTEEVQCVGGEKKNQVGTAAHVGAALFALWGILHVYVGVEGLLQYFVSPAKKQWEMLIGGSDAPVSGFKFPSDPLTIKVHANLIANFCLDVGGYGLLGLVVAWMISTQASWTGYLIGLFVIGLCDLSFATLMVHAGVIRADIYTVGGPIIWFLAVFITPFGLPSLL